MGKLLAWLVAKRRDFQLHFNTKEPACKPPSDWLISVFALQKLMEICDKYIANSFFLVNKNW